MERPPARPESTNESKEKYTELLGRMTLYRHGDTTYTGQYPDLTDEGKWKLEEAGASLKERVDEGEEDLIFIHSPSARAKASMAHLLYGMEKIASTDEGNVEEIARAYGPLRPVGRTNHEESGKMVDEHMAKFPEGTDQYEEFDRVYALHDDFENSPHWEKRSDVERRGERLLRQSVAMLARAYDPTTKVPHIIAVSHFEVLNNIAIKIFGLDLEQDTPYKRGEQLTLEVKRKPDGGSRVLLEAGFRGERKDAWVDLNSGAITPAV